MIRRRLMMGSVSWTVRTQSDCFITKVKNDEIIFSVPRLLINVWPWSYVVAHLLISPLILWSAPAPFTCSISAGRGIQLIAVWRFIAQNLSLSSLLYLCMAGLGGSVGCAVRLEIRRSCVQPPPRSATFLRGDWSWNIFYGHSLPSADSRRAVVSFWRKNVHNTG